MTITLTREEAQQVLDALDEYYITTDEGKHLVETLRARLAEPERKWQELSDYDVDNIVKASSGRESAVYLAEAKLKEKNT
jgi:polyhydroxyalkanoate synthesis regulator phasin